MSLIFSSDLKNLTIKNKEYIPSNLSSFSVRRKENRNKKLSVSRETIKM